MNVVLGWSLGWPQPLKIEVIWVQGIYWWTMATFKGENWPNFRGWYPEKKLTCLAGEATICPDIFPVDVMEIFHLKMLNFHETYPDSVCVFFRFLIFPMGKNALRNPEAPWGPTIVLPWRQQCLGLNPLVDWVSYTVVYTTPPRNHTNLHYYGLGEK